MAATDGSVSGVGSVADVIVGGKVGSSSGAGISVVLQSAGQMSGFSGPWQIPSPQGDSGIRDAATALAVSGGGIGVSIGTTPAGKLQARPANIK